MPTWLRVRDKLTGHEYDVAPSAVRDQHEVLEDYPANSSTTAAARPAKARTRPRASRPQNRSGSAAAPTETAPTETAGSGPEPEDETAPTS